MIENSKWDFLTSTRFWALVIGGLAIASQGNFTIDAWGAGVIFVISGFTAVRTVDRLGDKKVEAANNVE